jgi:EAL domain-containing protein (putative c-di-GMP-specific phosphodiesterase class I)
LTAEGVETRVEAEFVKEAGVAYVQGWLYAKAMPGPDAKAFWLEINGE